MSLTVMVLVQHVVKRLIGVKNIVVIVDHLNI